MRRVERATVVIHGATRNVDQALTRLAGNRGQEADSAEVRPDHGNVGAQEAGERPEHRPVAAEAHGEIGRPSTVAVEQCDTGGLGHGGETRERFVDVPRHPVGNDGGALNPSHR